MSTIVSDRSLGNLISLIQYNALAPNRRNLIFH